MAKKKAKPRKKKEKLFDDVADMTDMSLDELHEYLMDFDGATDEDVVPSSKYHIAVTEAEIEQGGKAPYIAMRLKILTGEHKDSLLFHNLTLSPKPFPRRKLKQAVAALLGDDVGKASPGKVAKLMVGKTAVVATGQEEYEGEMRARVKRFLPYKSGQVVADTSSDDGLDDLFDEDDEDWDDDED